jgi:putative DNA primase/helicase
MTTDMQTAAVEYALQGKKVLPCKQDKAPYTPNGFKDATSQVDQISDWWKRWPKALIGYPYAKIMTAFWELT